MKWFCRIALLSCALLAPAPAGAAAESRPTAGRTPAARLITPAQLKATLASHKGHVLVLHFWATWCPPCVKELPLLARLARDASSRGIDFLPVSLDDPTERSATWVGRLLAAKTGDPLWSPILRWNPDEAFIDEVDPGWRGEIPVFFSYDREGHLRHTLVGNLGRGDFERLVGDLMQPEKN